MIELHYIVNPAMEGLEKNYFRPSLPPGFHVHRHPCEIQSSGNFMRDGYLDILAARTAGICAEIESRCDGAVMVWSDVDMSGVSPWISIFGWRRFMFVQHSCGGGEGGGRLDNGDELLALAGEGAEVAFHLDAVPEGVGLAEEGTEADRHGRSDGAFAEHDIVDRSRRHADGAGHGVLGNPHGLEVFLEQDIAGCNGSFHVWGQFPQWNISAVGFSTRAGAGADGGGHCRSS